MITQNRDLMFNEVYNWIVEQIETNQFFGAAAFASVAAALFATLKGVPKKIWDRVIVLISYRVTIYQTDELYDYVTKWISDNHKSKARNVEYSTRSIEDGMSNHSIDFEYSVGKKAKDITEIPIQDFFWMRKYGRWIRVSFGQDKLENASNLKSVYLKNFSFKGVFAAKAIRKLLNEVNQTYGNSKKDPRFFIARDNYFSYMQHIVGKPVSQVVLNKSLKDSILTDINIWRDEKANYERRGISYKRGHCYYGPPGTGKTTLARAIAIEYEMDIYSVSLNNISSDSAMVSMFSEVRPNSILLFEDIDAYFKGRSQINTKSKITFSGLLNSLDGALQLNGVLVILTTNHLENLDPALLRPGRIDLVKEIGFAGREEVEEYLQMFYLQEIKIPFEISTPMCNVQNVCLENPENPKLAIKELEKLVY